MGQGSINQPGKIGSPIEGILSALQAVHAYYGIDTQKAQQKLLGTEQAQKELGLKSAQERSDPNSSASKLAQSEAADTIGAYEKAGVKLPSKSAMLAAIQGSQGADGATTPGLSAADLDANKESSPIAKFVGEKMHADAQKNAFAFRDNQLGEKQKFNENKLAFTTANKDPELITSQTRLNGLLRVNDIIKKVESGELKGTNQLKNSIANEYAKLETGGSAGLGQSERAQMANTLQGDANDLWTRISGKINPDGSISPDQMKQLKGELGTMGESYMQQFDQRHDALRQGFMYPESQATLDSKVNSIRQSFAKRFGGWSGLSGSGGDGKGVQMGLQPSQPSATPAAGGQAASNDGQDPVVQQYSKMHGLDYGTSQAILKKRGYAGSTAAR